MDSSDKNFLYDDSKRPENPYTSSPKGPAENPYQSNPAATPNPYGSWGQPNQNGTTNPWAQPANNPYNNPPANPYTSPSYSYQAQPQLEEFKQLPRQRRIVWDQSKMAQPFWTYVLLAIIAAFFVGQVATGYSLSGNSNRLGTLTNWGVLYKPYVLNGEWWRVITAIFLHFGLQHIFFNAMALLIFGMQIEPWFGGKRFVTFFMLTGIAGSILALLTTSDNSVAAGASGSIFGILGASLAFFFRNRASLGAYGDVALRNMVINLGLNLVFTFAVPGIGIQAHIGGLVTGLFLGYFVTPLQARPFPTDRSNTGNAAQSFLLNWWPAIVLAIAEVAAFYLALHTGTTLPYPNYYQ